MKIVITIVTSVGFSFASRVVDFGSDFTLFALDELEEEAGEERFLMGAARIEDEQFVWDFDAENKFVHFEGVPDPADGPEDLSFDWMVSTDPPQDTASVLLTQEPLTGMMKMEIDEEDNTSTESLVEPIETKAEKRKRVRVAADLVVAAKVGKKGKGRAAKKSPTSVAAFADFDDAPPSPQYFGLRGPPQKILDEKPGRFVFRFNLVNKTMTYFGGY